jgi:hypothetical protein
MNPNHNLAKMLTIIFNFNVSSPPTKPKSPCSKRMPYKNKHKKQIVLPSYVVHLCGNLYVLKSLQDLVATHYSRE